MSEFVEINLIDNGQSLFRVGFNKKVLSVFNQQICIGDLFVVIIKALPNHRKIPLVFFFIEIFKGVWRVIMNISDEIIMADFGGCNDAFVFEV